MSYSLKLADPRLKWENLLDSSPHFAVGWELHVKKFPKRELLRRYQIFKKQYKDIEAGSPSKKQYTHHFSSFQIFKRGYIVLNQMVRSTWQCARLEVLRASSSLSQCRVGMNISSCIKYTRDFPDSQFPSFFFPLTVYNYSH
jgi:hypothetical protein